MPPTPIPTPAQLTFLTHSFPARSIPFIPVVSPCTPLCLASTRPVPPRRPRPPAPPALSTAIRTRSTTTIPHLLRTYLHPDAPHVPHIATWQAAVRACIAARDPDALAKCLREPLSSPLLIHLRLAHFVRPLRMLAVNMRWNHVIDILQMMHAAGPPVVPDQRMVVALANLAVDKRLYQISLSFFDFMKDAAIPMGPHAYSVLLKSHARASNIVAVKRIVHHIKTIPIQFDSILFNTTVDAFVRCDDMQTATALVRDMQYQPLVDCATYNTLIKGYANQGQVDNAFQALSTMQSAGLEPNHVTRNTLLSACVNARHFVRAWSLLDPNLSDINTINLPESSQHTQQQQAQLTIALTSLVAGLADSGRTPDAIHLLNDMTRRNAPPSPITYAALITACFRNKDQKNANAVFASIPPHLLNLTVSNAYISGLCRTASLAKVEQAAALVEHRLLRHHDEEPMLDQATFNSLIDGYVRCAEFEKAEYYLELMQRARVQPGIISFTILINGYANVRKYADAKRIFKQIAQRGLKPDRVALNSFISISARTGDLAIVERLLAHMEQEGAGLSPDAYSYAPLLTAYAKVADNQKVWDTYQRMKQNGILVNSYHVQFLTEYIKRALAGSAPSLKKEQLAVAAAQLLKDAYKDGVSIKILRKCRRRLLALFTDPRSQKHLRQLDSPELRSASETIFEQHGWNNIDSGWRVL